MYTLKKQLGQHFLRDENICRKIVEQLKQRPFSKLLEVGPGGGALTKYLLELADIDFKAVELDAEKVQWLLRQYPSLEGRIIHQSFLNLEQPFGEPFTIIGNFPYNISTQILFHILNWRPAVECVIGMFQKEVAQRVAAPPGSKTYGVMSVIMQAWFNTEYLFEVHENCFNPPPKVKSAVIRLLPRTDTPAMRSDADFLKLVKAAFNQRRKMMRNAVKALFSPTFLENTLFDKRAEQLSVNDFAALTFSMTE